MTRYLLPVSVLLFLGLTPLAVTPAVAYEPPRTGDRTWEGVVKVELRKAAPRTGYIADKAAWATLWKLYRENEKVPDVDFDRELILVKVNEDPNRVAIDAQVDDQGDLTVACRTTLKRYINPATCAYQFACIKREGIKTIDDRPIVTSGDRAEVVRGNTRFALDLYGQLAAQDGNLVYSPHSITAALAMTHAGARGSTAEQMARTLHFPLQGDKLHAALGELLQESNGDPRERQYRLYTANALWGQKEYPFRDSFLKETEQNYSAGLFEVDFSKDTEGSRQRINVWVEKQTQHKIEDLLPKGILTTDTRLVLTNAIYFLGNWEHPFDPKQTRPGDFQVSATETVQVPLMHQTLEARHLGNAKVRILELPYKGKDLALLVLLPGEKKSLADLEKELTAENLETWVAQLREGDVAVALPRIKVSGQFSLKKQLTALGMSAAFTGEANFSGMTSVEKLRLAEVVHKGFIDVNESGTEAAAATGGIMEKVSSLKPSFTVDRPFVFLIRDNRNGSVLFLGRVVNPTRG